MEDVTRKRCTGRGERKHDVSGAVGSCSRRRSRIRHGDAGKLMIGERGARGGNGDNATIAGRPENAGNEVTLDMNGVGGGSRAAIAVVIGAGRFLIASAANAQ